jgi:hypothetical protein
MLLEEFALSRRMRPLVEDQMDRLRANGGRRWLGDANWWRRVRWKDGSPLLSPITKSLYLSLVVDGQLQEKLDKGWLREGDHIDWRRWFGSHWKSKLEAKIKLFFWKLLHKGLPVGDRISHFVEESRCIRCEERETIEHICWTGCVARDIWGEGMTGQKVMVAYSKVKGKEIIPILAWCCWRIRNLMVFEGVSGTVQEAKATVMRLAEATIYYQATTIKEKVGGILQQVKQGKSLPSVLGLGSL